MLGGILVYKVLIHRDSATTMVPPQLPPGSRKAMCDQMIVSADKNYRTILLEELEQRCKRNNRYTPRAFARFLGLTSARLSEILNKKSGLSRESAAKIGKRLEFNAQEIAIFCDLVESEHARSHAKRQFAKIKLQKYLAPEYKQVRLDTFKVISDWYCFAILELSKLDIFQSNERWISKALGITPTQAKTAVERLTRLNLLEMKDGKLRSTEDFRTTPNDVPSDSIKKFHQQILEKATASLYTQPIDQRDYSAVVLGIEMQRLPEAKALIKEFRRDFVAKMSHSKTNDDVYCLSLQFFNLAPTLEDMK